MSSASMTMMNFSFSNPTNVGATNANAATNANNLSSKTAAQLGIPTMKRNEAMRARSNETYTAPLTMGGGGGGAGGGEAASPQHSGVTSATSTGAVTPQVFTINGNAYLALPALVE